MGWLALGFWPASEAVAWGSSRGELGSVYTLGRSAGQADQLIAQLVLFRVCQPYNITTWCEVEYKLQNEILNSDIYIIFWWALACTFVL